MKKQKTKTMIFKKGSKMPTPEEFDEIFEAGRREYLKSQKKGSKSKKKIKKPLMIERWEADNIQDEFKSLLK